MSEPNAEPKRQRFSLIDIALGEGLIDTYRTSFGERLSALSRCASRLNIDLQVFSPPQVLRLSPANRERLLRSDRIWIYGAIPEPGEYQTLEAALAALFGRELDEKLVETWDQFDEAFSLARSYPIIAKSPVPQAETVFCQLPQAWARAPALRRKLSLRLALWRLRRSLEQLAAERKSAPWPRFLRSFYGTTKRSAFESFIESPEEILEKAERLVEEVRGQHPIGGLALREMLPIKLAWDSSQRGPVQREYRVIIFSGAPIFWSIDVSLDELVMRFSEAQILEMVQLEEALLRQMLDWSRELGQRFRAKLLCADFAVLAGDRLTLVETNGGMSCGWAHDAALVGVFGRVLAELSGKKLSRPDLEALCEDCGINRWGQGVAYDFVVEGEEARAFQDR